MTQIKALGAFLALFLIISLSSDVKRNTGEIWAYQRHVKRSLHITEKTIEDFGRFLNVEITFYTATCSGCIGITKTGVDVRNTVTHNGYGIIAVDPNVIPLGSIVEIEGRLYSAEDTGGAIKGRRIDVLVKSRKIALQLGRVKREVFVYN